MKHSFREAVFSAALGVMVACASHAAVVQDKAKCAEGIGCNESQPDRKPTAPQLKKPATSETSPRNTSPGLGKGIMEAPPGSFGERAKTPTALASANNECRSRLDAEADRSVGGTHYRSYPEFNASQCIRLGTRTSSFGPGFANTCGHRVVFTFCAFRPKKDSWAEAFDCEKTKGGTELIEPRSEIAAHTTDAEYFYWAGCRFPEALPADFKFSAAKGYEFRCNAWGQERTTSALASHRGTACETADVVRSVADRIEADRIAAQRQPPAAAQQASQRGVPSGDPLAQCQSEWANLVSLHAEIDRLREASTNYFLDPTRQERSRQLSVSRNLACSPASLTGIDQSVAKLEADGRSWERIFATSQANPSFSQLTKKSGAEHGLVLNRLALCDARALRQDYVARCGR
ncbi:MAG: hypothetical protein RLZZ126_396 [Pseudomonadota bacterium]|jgi:hypothetical protein